MLSQTTRCLTRILRTTTTTTNKSFIQNLSHSPIPERKLAQSSHPASRTIATTTINNNEDVVVQQHHQHQQHHQQHQQKINLLFPIINTVEDCDDRKDPLILSIENRTGILQLMEHPSNAALLTNPTPPSSSSSLAPVESIIESYEMLNRNARKPRKANHGKRPCSRYGRRKRSRQHGKPGRGW